MDVWASRYDITLHQLFLLLATPSALVFVACSARSLNVAAQAFASAERGFSNKYEFSLLEGGHVPHIQQTERLLEILSTWLSSA
jgi:hypothetical protein